MAIKNLNIFFNSPYGTVANFSIGANPAGLKIVPVLDVLGRRNPKLKTKNLGIGIRVLAPKIESPGYAYLGPERDGS